ncbi:hypothetical protein GGR50DRAFT_5847 [Xylaria sp. CBS 124048]|nr:hypothetical protein GGR50DRAFT_5847 [Xylaria sp. CBS 124048]
MESAPPSGFQTNVFRAVPKDGVRKIQKRNRPPVSCLLCRTRKVKCDRQLPCQRCLKSGEAQYCEYAPRARKSRDDQPSQSSARTRIDTRPRVLEERIEKLQALLITLARPPPSTASSNTSSGLRPGDTRPSLDPRLVGNPSGDGSYVGNTHWTVIFDKMRDIKGLLKAIINADDDRSDSSPTPSSNLPTDGPDPIFGKSDKITQEQAVRQLPPRHRTDQLILFYFRHRFTAAPYIHTEKFKREYDNFWRDPTSVSLLWISCLASILWIAISIAGLEADSALWDTPPPERLAVLAVNCLISGDYLSAKPYSIEALLLHGFTEMRRKDSVDSSIWAKFGLAARLAQRMGYNRDPTYLSNVTPFEGEIRRRVWLYIELSDVMFSFQQGVPPIIRDDECDTQSPSNLHDSDFDESVMVLPPSRPHSDVTPTLYLSFKSELCHILRRILRLSLAIHGPAYEEVLRLENELHSYRIHLPTPLQIKPIRSYSFTEPTYNIMHRLMLEMMFLRSQCVLHRPYLIRDKDNPKYEMSRKICRDAALKILDIHADYEQESKPGGRMYEDKYMLSSLTLHDFLLASIITCLDLLENPSDKPADNLRRLQALETSYYIWHDRKNTSGAAAHATRVSGAILRKLSLQDPGFLTPSQSKSKLQPQPQPRPRPPPPPQTDVRSQSSLAILLNNDSHLPPRLTAAKGQSSHNSLIDSFYTNTTPIDRALRDSSNIDWNLIDHILFQRPVDTYHPYNPEIR